MLGLSAGERERKNVNGRGARKARSSSSVTFLSPPFGGRKDTLGKFDLPMKNQAEPALA